MSGCHPIWTISAPTLTSPHFYAECPFRHNSPSLSLPLFITRVVKTLPSVLWRCWLGGRKGIQGVKNSVVECWCGLEQGADLHMTQMMPLPLTISCFSKIHIGFTFFWYWLTRVVPEKGPLIGCVCVCVSSQTRKSGLKTTFGRFLSWSNYTTLRHNIKCTTYNVLSAGRQWSRLNRTLSHNSAASVGRTCTAEH